MLEDVLRAVYLRQAVVWAISAAPTLQGTDAGPESLSAVDGHEAN